MMFFVFGFRQLFFVDSQFQFIVFVSMGCCFLLQLSWFCVDFSSLRICVDLKSLRVCVDFYGFFCWGEKMFVLDIMLLRYQEIDEFDEVGFVMLLMMRQSGYDFDVQFGDFDDYDFFED